MTISAIVLAAGQATRFGQCKQVLRLGDKTILDHVLDNLRASSVDEIVVVLGAHADEIRATVRIPERIVMNPDFANGMSTSIQAGLRAIDANAEAALIVLGDQPFVNPRTIDQLVDEWRRAGATAIVPTYNGTRGNPVLVGRALFDKMLTISGDVGCRAILGDPLMLAVDDRGVVLDIDTKDDLDAVTGPATSQPYATATVVRAERPTSSKPGDKAVIAADGTLTGWIGGSCAHDLVVKNALEALRDGEPRLLAISPGDAAPAKPGVIGAPMQCYSGGSLDVFIEPHFPAPQLVVIGTQPIARALVKIAGTMAFHVIVIEEEAQLSTLPLRDEVFVVIATHGRFDEAALEQALRTSARYIALVSSRKRAEVIVGQLRESGVPGNALARIKAPAGLNIGARGADEIALSILAEIIQVRRTAVVPEALAPVNAVDPICRMTVAIEGAKQTVEHDGQRFYFCGEHCRRTFERDPQRYAQGA